MATLPAWVTDPEAALPATPCLAVTTDVEMHYSRRRRLGGRFSFRRPDVTVYRCIGRGDQLTSSDAVMVIEVISPGSEYIDTVDKKAQYADAMDLQDPFPVTIPFSALDG